MENRLKWSDISPDLLWRPGKVSTPYKQTTLCAPHVMKIRAATKASPVLAVLHPDQLQQLLVYRHWGFCIYTVRASSSWVWAICFRCALMVSPCGALLWLPQEGLPVWWEHHYSRHKNWHLLEMQLQRAWDADGNSSVISSNQGTQCLYQIIILIVIRFELHFWISWFQEVAAVDGGQSSSHVVVRALLNRYECISLYFIHFCTYMWVCTVLFWPENGACGGRLSPGLLFNTRNKLKPSELCGCSLITWSDTTRYGGQKSSHPNSDGFSWQIFLLSQMPLSGWGRGSQNDPQEQSRSNRADSPLPSSPGTKPQLCPKWAAGSSTQ